MIAYLDMGEIARLLKHRIGGELDGATLSIDTKTTNTRKIWFSRSEKGIHIHIYTPSIKECVEYDVDSIESAVSFLGASISSRELELVDVIERLFSYCEENCIIIDEDNLLWINYHLKRAMQGTVVNETNPLISLIYHVDLLQSRVVE